MKRDSSSWASAVAAWARPVLFGLSLTGVRLLAGEPAAPSAVETRSTFHCISLYWPRSEAGPCRVAYRVAGEPAWQEGQDLWYDRTTGTRVENQYRGSLVNLRPGTAYEIKLTVDGAEQSVRAATWGEQFKIRKTIRITEGETFATTEGGSATEGYVLYDGSGVTIDQRNRAANVIAINHGWVIVRGLTVINAEKDAMQVAQGLADVVIERCDISNWGSPLKPAVNPRWGRIEAGIRVGSTCRRVIIQRNRIHHPRYCATKWYDDPADVHPRGPRAIMLGHRSDDEDWEANHVVRYNEFYSDPDHLFEDVIGGGVNWSKTGHPGRDSDIYSNLVTHASDDLIEADGGGQNVRIWGNYLDHGNVMVSLQSCTVGPVYIFRNIFGRSLAYSLGAKAGSSGFKFRGNGGVTSPAARDYAPFRGRVYFYHNTRLYADDFPNAFDLGYKDHVRNVISRNNILPSTKHYLYDQWDGRALAIPQGQVGDQGKIIDQIKQAAAENKSRPPFNPGFVECSFDYDLANRPSEGDSVAAVLGAHGILGEAQWRPGHGPEARPLGAFQLSSKSPGYNAAAYLPNFNRGPGEFGGAPDVGAHEHGAPGMQFGVDATWLVP